MELKLCPKHACELIARTTKFGIRYGCSKKGCTVACWDGDNSTPADHDTRQERISAHDFFDYLWKTGMMTRKKAYCKLSNYLELSVKDCHIGLFNKTMALRTQEFARNISGL